MTHSNIFKELGVLDVGHVQGYSFCPQKNETHKTSILVYVKFCGTREIWITVNFPISLIAAWRLNIWTMDKKLRFTAI